MPRITSARLRARAATRGSTHHCRDWCDRCYADGQYSLAIGPARLCFAHRGPRATRAGSNRPGQPGRRRPLPPHLAAARARCRAAGLRYGKKRAARRQHSATYEVHPGWRGRIPAKFHVVADQREALAQIERAIDREMWSPRQRAEWKTMLESMVHTMDWDTGLVIGVTREHLARLTGRSTRSVSRMWAWAQNVGLIVRVEEGASASWLGTSRNRSAAFAFVTDTPGRAAALAASSADEPTAEQVVDQYGNPPASCVEKKPLERPNQKHQPKWPAFRIPETPSQRLAAAKIMVTRAGLDAQSLDQQRLCGLLRAWWADGACVAELLWAIDHHPDSPDHPRGDALRGARDPIAVLGHRLSPWVGRTAELPETLRGRRGDYLAAQARRLADATGLPMASAFVAPSRKDVRAAAQAALRAHLETQRLKRGRLATTHGSR